MIEDIRIGIGYDVHRLAEGRSLILGGVTIDHPKGLAGHSDADVLLHAITDAMFGALALGDIGTHFSDQDEAYKGIDSRELLREAMQIIGSRGWKVGNVDATVAAQKPKLTPHVKAMRKNIAKDLEIDVQRVSVKATTTEGLGFEGTQKGMSARASVLLVKVAGDSG